MHDQEDKTHQHVNKHCSTVSHISQGKNNRVNIYMRKNFHESLVKADFHLKVLGALRVNTNHHLFDLPLSASLLTNLIDQKCFSF